jgi:DNA-binding CsgD family transcriptional regulator
MDSQIAAIHSAMRDHDLAIAGCKGLLDQHSTAMARLEQLVSVQTTAMPPAPNRPTEAAAGSALAAEARPDVVNRHKLDIDHFSQQEKRLLAIFFQNRNMEMSYADVARVLGKSAYTVKNQMNQIRRRADLFHRSTGDQGRNRFRLKEDLRIEQYLHVGRAVESPASTFVTDQSHGPEGPHMASSSL